MDKNLHLVLMWHNSLYKFEDIVLDLNNKFKIRGVFNIEWDNRLFKDNLLKFYANNLSKYPDEEINRIINHKADHCGEGNFVAIVIEDKNPVIENRNTSSGTEIVNSNIFDCKQLYREWTGGGHKIHTSNTTKETNNDLTLLMGLNLNDFDEKYNVWDETIEELQLKVPGVGGWKNINELFYVLNSTMDYVVLRNFEPLPDQYHVDNHGDIDLLVDGYKKAVILIGGKNTETHQNCVHHYVKIDNNTVPFDFRYVGDNYYDENWQRNIIKNRIFVNSTFYAPNNEDYFYSLLYHATVQKFEDPMPVDYREKLLKISNDFDIEFTEDISDNNSELKYFLTSYMVNKGYDYIRPLDPSVSSPKLEFYSGK